MLTVGKSKRVTKTLYNVWLMINSIQSGAFGDVKG